MAALGGVTPLDGKSSQVINRSLKPNPLYGIVPAPERAAAVDEPSTRVAQEGREFSMNRLLALSLALAAAVSVSACQTPQQQNALVGGTLGAGTGALVGSAVSGGSAGSTIAGAAIGAGTGALIGAAATPQPVGRCGQWAYDYNGNRICVAFY